MQIFSNDTPLPLPTEEYVNVNKIESVITEVDKPLETNDDNIDKKKFVCGECNKEFSNKTSLNAHQRL